eukprot:TRINITY_DN2621_c0_g2_i1.p1 TRINITY_DN2621_c0_g2~~TRINITY_DN2621_c0_g2_i1.p1  ORF type:complete len:784 (+),score=323.38 TRINITY_DN2621_c0_g2_i1:163-2514(+)
MRIITKGGVWKNTEDEILKAAVMKYGKNQWARISSLLVRKSAKQCKARWMEWLDPSIKKTEWSREEEEKLLHLAKIMPTQWRTIAPMVGRTAAQCMEHYEKLLDAAQNRDEDYDPADDPRRLRPGEIDPNPETKPARPDPVDMDEDEKEMLSEARARLANTKGKKAKRKAREKQLEEARRLASLQKRRELKAAGIELRRHKRKSRGIDYNAEIPFHKKPAPGFFEVDFSDQEKFKQLPLGGGRLPPTMQQMDGKRRADAEAQEQKLDVDRAKKRAKTDLPSAIQKLNDMNDPENTRQRSKLVMPEPQLSDRELEEIARMGLVDGQPDAAAVDFDAEGGNAATKTLLGATPAARTPAAVLGKPGRTALSARTPAREDSLRREAQNLIALNQGATPLMGGDNPALHPSDFSGVTPRRVEAKTPNVLATPLRTAKQTGLTPGNTPFRDGLSINDQAQRMAESKYDDRRKRTELIKALQAGLKTLPAPQNEYKVMLPELPAEEAADDQQQDDQAADASDVLAAQRKRQQELEAERMRMRSQVLKRELPRPVQLHSNFANVPFPTEPVRLLQHAEELIRKEMVSLIIHDSTDYPLRNSRIPTATEPRPDDVTEAELNEARRLLDAEIEAVERRHFPDGIDPTALDEAFARSRELVYVPTLNKYSLLPALAAPDKVAALTAEFELTKAQATAESAAAKKLEKKLFVYHGGYSIRNQQLQGQIQNLVSQLDNATLELQCFRALRDLETKAIPARIEEMRNLVKIQQQRETENQQIYANLMDEKTPNGVKA